jgi:DNA/RNA-binding domain of Phe-tRNA-synthetase-like protein
VIDLKLNVDIHVGIIEVEGLRVTEDRGAYEELEACAAEYRRSHGNAPPSEIPGVQTQRKLFRALRIDPTRTRPSSEALLRRALKGKQLYAINTLVDVGNWCSLDFLLSLGLYDRDKIAGTTVEIREGLEGEGYDGIRKGRVNVESRYCLADADGPFGAPTSDSLRTSVTTDTTTTLMVIIAPADYDLQKLQQQAQTAADRIVRFCGGEIARVEAV